MAGLLDRIQQNKQELQESLNIQINQLKSQLNQVNFELANTQTQQNILTIETSKLWQIIKFILRLKQLFRLKNK